MPFRLVASVCLIASVACVVANVSGCEDPAGSVPQGGAAANVVDAPKSILGKAVKSGKDTRDAISGGGSARDAAVLSAKVRLEQFAETISAMKGRTTNSDAEKAVADAQVMLDRAESIVRNAEENTAADDGSDAKKIQAAVKDVEKAIKTAKDML
jgi:hypothetical protein